MLTVGRLSGIHRPLIVTVFGIIITYFVVVTQMFKM
jgi:hypothetical protein